MWSVLGYARASTWHEYGPDNLPLMSLARGTGIYTH